MFLGCLSLALVRSATCLRYHRRLPTYRREPGREALTRSLGERSAGVVGGRARRAALFLLATFLMLLNWGPLSTSTTISRKAGASRCVSRSSVSPGDSAAASRWRGLPRAPSMPKARAEAEPAVWPVWAACVNTLATVLLADLSPDFDRVCLCAARAGRGPFLALPLRGCLGWRRRARLAGYA